MAKIRKAAQLALGVLTVWITAGVWYSRPLTPTELLDGDPPRSPPGPGSGGALRELGQPAKSVS